MVTRFVAIVKSNCQLACLSFYFALGKSGEDSLNFLKQTVAYFDNIMNEDPSILKLDELTGKNSLETYGILQVADLYPPLKSHLMVQPLLHK